MFIQKTLSVSRNWDYVSQGSFPINNVLFIQNIGPEHIEIYATSGVTPPSTERGIIIEPLGKINLTLKNDGSDEELYVRLLGANGKSRVLVVF